MSKKNIQLVVIDPQNDFTSPHGSLFVPGADKDMERLGAMINRISKKLTDIHVSLDSHRLVDIAHPIMHVNSKGEHPSPFTIITESDYDKGVWKCSNPAWQTKVRDYLRQLAANKRYPLCIWPPHCLIAATKKIPVPSKEITALNKGYIEFCGHAVSLPVSEALVQWENDNFGVVDYITKGSNIMTEHYSFYKADVPDPSDPSTMPNTEFIEIIQEADEIPFAGEALSHCVANSIKDIADAFGDENIEKFVLIQDCCSNVPGFEKLGQDFIKSMTKRGMRVTTSVDYLA
jgi:nicotinamidase/pyrazinamidase